MSSLKMIDQEIGLKWKIIKHLGSIREKKKTKKHTTEKSWTLSSLLECLNLAFQNYSKQQFWAHKTFTLWPEIWQFDETVVSTVKIMAL